MGKTRHIQARMSQRAINQKLLDLTLEFGVEHRDGKVILNRRGLDLLAQQLDDLRKVTERAANKGGIVVVKENDALITTYGLDSHRVY